MIKESFKNKIESYDDELEVDVNPEAINEVSIDEFSFYVKDGQVHILYKDVGNSVDKFIETPEYGIFDIELPKTENMFKKVMQ